MQLKELMMDKLQVFPPLNAEKGLKSEKSSYGTDGRTSSFNDVLNTAVRDERNESKSLAYSSRTTRNDNSANRKEDIQDNAPTSSEHRTYRQIVLEKQLQSKSVKAQNAEKADAKATQNEKLKDDEHTAKSLDQNNSAIFNMFAQNLGLKPDELQTVLDAAGITSDELGKASDVTGITNKLSNIMELDKGQTKILAQLLNSLKAQTGASALAAGGINALDGIPAAASELQTDSSKTIPDTGVTEADAKILAKAPANAQADLLNEMADKVRVQILSAVASGNSAANADTTGKAQNINEFSALVLKAKLMLNSIKEQLEKAGSIDGNENIYAAVLTGSETGVDSDATAVSLNSVKTDGKIPEEITGTSVKAAEVGKPQEDKGNTASKGEEIKPVQAKADEKTESSAKYADVKPADKPAANTADVQQTLIPGQDLKLQQAAAVEKPEIKAYVPAKEVINQVIEKAKVVLTGDKSEMVMDLKPDSLGKLSLKVVTEHGIVMAKFVAESQQVKQVLESNMQTLKDTLESQGLNVQGFSVSVGQDPRSGYQNRGNADQSGNGRENDNQVGSSYWGAKTYNQTEGITAINNSGVYGWGTSTVNYTA